MRPKKLFIVLFLIILVLLPVTPALADEVTVNDIAKQLICQCGCGIVLADCGHAVCTSRDEMLTLIEQKIAQGQSEEEIIQFFVARYGEQVLASLPKRGFNLVAWLLPFVAILGGGGIIYITLRKWVKRGKSQQRNAVAKAEESDEEYRRRLEKELEEFNEKGFR